jgi:4-amino-4-deoxy-L-arabinose transferase-like glycosyltransferase
LTLATAVVVALATAVALAIRLIGLPGWEGTLSVDEARLAMAAHGVAEQGVPMLPSGWIYTRGLLVSYATAPSLALLSGTDFAARLPSVVAGAALVPVMYLLGATVAGRVGGLFAALFVVSYPPLVVWSRQAWLYALYVLLYCVALTWIVRAHRSSRRRDQILAGALVGLTLFAHELGAFLLIPLAAQIVARVRRPDRDLAAIGWSIGLALGAVCLLVVLVTALRAPTLAGRYGEIAEYFGPHLEGVPFRFYGRMLADGRWLVLVAALAGLPLALAQRQFESAILWLALLPPFIHAVTIVPEQPQERYGLTFMPVLLLLAALGVQDIARWAGERFHLPVAPRLITAAVLAVTLAAHQNVAAALGRSALSPSDGTWLVEARELGIGPADLVMADLPTVVGWYVGGLDYWITSRDYQKYTVPDGNLLRDLHTGALLVRTRSEFQNLAAQPNQGRTLWIVASGRGYQWHELVDDDLKAYIERSASQRYITPDGFRIYRLDL